MSTTYNPTATWHSPISILADGDKASAANFNLAPKDNADNAEYLRKVVEEDGIARIKSGTNFPSEPNNNDTFLLLTNDNSEVGIFIYRANATATADGIMVYDGPDGPVDPGRWLHVSYTVKGLIDGIAPLDGEAKVPNANLHRGEANGVASLDASSKVVQDPASKGLAGGVAAIGADGEIEATSTNVSTAAMKATSAGGNIGRLGGGYGASGADPSGAEGRLGAQGHGVWAIAGEVEDAHAVLADGNNSTTTAAAVRAMGGLGPGIEASSAGDVAGKFTANSARGAINILFNDNAGANKPAGSNGDMYVSTEGKLWVFAGGGWKQATLTT